MRSFIYSFGIALALFGSAFAHAQLSFIPVSGSEGLLGNTGAAKRGAANAPLTNPASAAILLPALPGEIERESPDEISLSSNVYMLSNIEMRGNNNDGNIPANFGSIPTSLGKRSRISGVDATFGIYQTELFQFDYRINGEDGNSWGRLNAAMSINRAGFAAGFTNEKHRAGFGLLVSNYNLKVGSHFLSAPTPQSGVLSTAWEERSRTDLSASFGYIWDATEHVSVGASVRSPSLKLFESTEGQVFFAQVSPLASSSSYSQSAPDGANIISGNGIEGLIGVAVDLNNSKLFFDLAMNESRGSNITNMAGETQVRIGFEDRTSDKNKWLYGLMLGLSDALGHDLYVNRKSLPITGSFGIEREIGDAKRISVGIFHNNSIDWEIVKSNRFSYAAFQRTGIIFSGAMSL